jgi:hypothetical protein
LVLVIAADQHLQRERAENADHRQHIKRILPGGAEAVDRADHGLAAQHAEPEQRGGDTRGRTAMSLGQLREIGIHRDIVKSLADAGENPHHQQVTKREADRHIGRAQREQQRAEHQRRARAPSHHQETGRQRRERKAEGEDRSDETARADRQAVSAAHLDKLDRDHDAIPGIDEIDHGHHQERGGNRTHLYGAGLVDRPSMGHCHLKPPSPCCSDLRSCSVDKMMYYFCLDDRLMYKT